MKPPSATAFYLKVYAALFVLLILTVGAAVLNLGSFNIVVALAIAVAKMMLIVLYFMHVREGTHLTWVFAVAGFFWLGILMVLTMSDYLSRAPAGIR
jgi:cytochrome c oxidase subunit 4